jgi:hypothetical protein
MSAVLNCCSEQAYRRTYDDQVDLQSVYIVVDYDFWIGAAERRVRGIGSQSHCATMPASSDATPQ